MCEYRGEAILKDVCGEQDIINKPGEATAKRKNISVVLDDDATVANVLTLTRKLFCSQFRFNREGQIDDGGDWTRKGELLI